MIRGELDKYVRALYEIKILTSNEYWSAYTIMHQSCEEYLITAIGIEK